MRNKRRRVLTVLVLIFCFYSFINAGVDIFGYFENRFFLVNNLDFSWNKFKEKFDIGDYNRLRLQMKASPSKKVRVNVAVDFFSFHGFVNSPLGTTPGQEAPEKNTKIDLDRAYVDLYFKKFDLTIGKQRVAIGVSYLWAPLDVFNRVNLLEPKEEKPGRNAVRAYVPLGSASGLTAIVAPDDKFNTSTSGFRAQTQVFGVDIGATAVHHGELGASIYGLDLRGENLVGWWLETGWFKHANQSDVKLVLGFDYTFPIRKGLYWVSEYFYDSSGANEKENYDYAGLAAGLRFTLGRSYLFSMLRYSFSDFLSASLSYIGNLGDGSFLLNPSLAYEIAQNISLSAGCYVPMGSKGGELHTQRKNIFFLYLKVNF